MYDTGRQLCTILKDITLNGAEKCQLCNILEGVNLVLSMKAMCIHIGSCQTCTIHKSHKQKILEKVKLTLDDTSKSTIKRPSNATLSLMMRSGCLKLYCFRKAHKGQKVVQVEKTAQKRHEGHCIGHGGYASYENHAQKS